MLKMSWLLSPWLILGGVISGGLIGVFNHDLALQLLPFGSLYLKFLQMLVLPILLTAVISGLGNLFTSATSRRHLTKILGFLLLSLLMVSLIGVLFGVLYKPGAELTNSSQITLGRTIADTENNPAPENHPPATIGLISFVEAMIPNNIFRALNQGDNLAILFFSILVGVSIGLIETPSSRLALNVIDAFCEVFLQIIGWLMYFLPLGLLCLVSGQIAQVGFDIILATGKFIICIYLACISTIILYSFIIWWQVRYTHSYFGSLLALKQPLLVALGTSSSLASIPAALSALKNNLNTDKNITDLVIPLGMVINPSGTVLHFAISSIFIAQLYNMPLDFSQMSIILIGAVLASLASSSAPGVVGLSMIAIILGPLGLPTNIAIILLVAIDPIIDPIMTALNVYGNCVMTVVAEEKTITE